MLRSECPLETPSQHLNQFKEGTHVHRWSVVSLLPVRFAALLLLRWLEKHLLLLPHLVVVVVFPVCCLLFLLLLLDVRKEKKVILMSITVYKLGCCVKISRENQGWKKFNSYFFPHIKKLFLSLGPTWEKYVLRESRTQMNQIRSSPSTFWSFQVGFESSTLTTQIFAVKGCSVIWEICKTNLRHLVVKISPYFQDREWRYHQY